jgi:hypothetical protein
MPPEIESVQDIEKVIALFEKADLEHNGRVNKGTPIPLGCSTLPLDLRRCRATEEFRVLLDELKKSGAATVAGSADKLLVDLVFDALDKDDSGELNLEEVLAGYHTLFADERVELARLLSPSFPCTTSPLFLDNTELIRPASISTE